MAPSLTVTPDTSDPNTWIEDSIQDIGDDIPENDEDGDDPKHRPREELVLVHDCLKEVVTKAEIRKNPFQDDRSADDECQANCEGSDNRQVGVSRRVPAADDSLGQTLCPSGQGKVLAHELEHGGPL